VVTSVGCGPCSSQPGMQRLAGDPELGRHHDLWLATLDRQHGTVALLDNGQVHQSQSRPLTPSSRTAIGKPIRPNVKHQVGPQRQASVGTTHGAVWTVPDLVDSRSGAAAESRRRNRLGDTPMLHPGISGSSR
jgi:hypothetical protein